MQKVQRNSKITIVDLQIISQNNYQVLYAKVLLFKLKKKKNIQNKKNLSCKVRGYSGREFLRTFSGCNAIKKPAQDPL